MEKKSNIRKVITVAVFVLLLIGAVYFYFSAPDDTESSYNSYNSDYSQSSQSEPISSAQSSQSTQSSQTSQSEPEVQKPKLKFRNSNLLNQHYEKHGIDMGFSSVEEYEQAAAAVPYHPDVLHKIEKEDGDDVYYIEATNEFVVVSGDGYLRTYFLPSAGKDYYDRQ